MRITRGRNDPPAVERLLRSLPGWFGIESAIRDYVEDARTMTTYLAEPGGDAGAPPAGVLLAVRHFPAAAEIHLIAVAPDRHRRGVGGALVDALELDLVAAGVTLLQVKTLGPSRPDEGYARTRAFYEALRFQPLEEIHGLWPGNPCLIMVKPLS